MKLKKIASLALAGVMAVSMLAGCKGTDGSNNSSSTTTTAASILDAINNGQDSSNKVKITFTADSKLDTAAKKVVASYNDGFTNSANQQKEIADYATIVATVTRTNPFYNNETNGAQPTNPKPKDGEKNTYFDVIKLGDSADSTTYLMNYAAKLINANVAGLDNTTLVTKQEQTEKGWTGVQTMDKDTYYDFSYTGTACMFSAPNSDGSVSYYMAYTITQTVAAKTFKV